jgi:hypothetical protein
MTDNPTHSNVHPSETDVVNATHATPKAAADNNPFVALRGKWPGDINDGFEKAIREMRDNELKLVKEPPPWW